MTEELVDAMETMVANLQADFVTHDAVEGQPKLEHDGLEGTVLDDARDVDLWDPPRHQAWQQSVP